MLFNYKIFFVIGFIFLLWKFSIQANHVISRLIILEGLILLAIAIVYITLREVRGGSILLILLAFAASEAALGLSLLVAIIRLYSNDNYKGIIL